MVGRIDAHRLQTVVRAGFSDRTRLRTVVKTAHSETTRLRKTLAASCSRGHRTGLAVLIMALFMCPGRVGAENEDHPPGWYLPVGGNLGMSLDGESVGLLLGAEVSAAFLEGTWWYGLFADGLYDFRDDRFRLCLGHELGWFIFGVDAGVVLEPSADALRWGTRLRGLVGGGPFVVYGGWTHLFEPEAGLGELGLLLKWPFKL